MICPICGRKLSATVQDYHYIESGLDNVFVSGVTLYKCRCGEEYVQLPGAQLVHDQIASELLKKSSLLTGAEAKFLRKWLRLTSEELAQALGKTRVSVSRWENTNPSSSADRTLRLYVSAVGNIPVNFAALFSALKNRPQQGYKVLIGDKELQARSLAAYKPTSPLTAPSSEKQTALSDFNKTTVASENVSATNQELAQAA
jgi:putative zinc finger/helix-turn-helix YgiT family protein